MDVLYIDEYDGLKIIIFHSYLKLWQEVFSW
jgi:hypothetical protein